MQLAPISQYEYVQYVDNFKALSAVTKQQSAENAAERLKNDQELKGRVTFINSVNARLSEGLMDRSASDVAALAAHYYINHENVENRWNSLFGTVEEYKICPVKNREALRNIHFAGAPDSSETQEKTERSFKEKAWHDYCALLCDYPELIPNEWCTNENGCYETHFDLDMVEEIVQANIASLTAKRIRAGDSPEVAKQKAIEWSQPGIVFEDQYAYILRDAVTSPTGHKHTYIRFLWKSSLGSKDGIAVLPIVTIDGVKKIALVVIHRHASGDLRLEIPRCMAQACDKNEEETAARESLQEAGVELDVDTIKPIGRMSPDTGLTGQMVKFFVGESSKPIKAAEPEKTEAILKTHYVSYPELVEGYKKGYLILEINGKMRRVTLDDSFTKFVMPDVKHYFE